MNRLKKYGCILFKSYKSQFTYRLSVISNIISAICKFFIQLNIWVALISSHVRNDVTVKEMMLYVVVNMVVLALTNADVSANVEDNIRDGIIAVYLTQPVSYKYYLICNILGKNAFALTFAIMPVVILSTMVIGIPIPRSFKQCFVTVIFILIGIILSFEISYVIGLIAFWLQTAWFLKFYLNAAITLFGGTAVPLWFYPKALERVCHYLPFRYITFEAVNYYINGSKVIQENLFFKILIGLGWILVIYLIGEVVWKRAVINLTVNGG